MTELSEDQLQYIEKFTAYGMQSGFTRSVAQVLGLLLVCHPPKQAAADIQIRLGLSTGSVSTATTLLTRVGLIDEIKVPGDRRLYYELKPDGFTRALEQGVRRVKEAKQVAKDGLKFDPNNQRMRNMYEVYDEFESIMVDFMKKLNALKKK